MNSSFVLLEQSCYPKGGLKTSNDDENALELVSDQLGSSKSFGLNDSFESESDEEPLLDMGFGHAASFNEFRSSLPPIQEEMEAGDHLAYTATDTDLLHLGGNGSEPCAFSYSSGSLAAGTSWIPDVSVVQDVDEELDSSPTTSLLDITLAQSSIETRDNSGTGPVTSGQENPYDIHGNVNLACKSLLLIGNGSGSEADPEHNVKRRQLTPLCHGLRVFAKTPCGT
ncbi:hypothetical protein KY290_007478 [Solanum tuberosum]|uniref:Uncharacterized protein n=1 Tax=Solanum tuberosum TaxID=4113 RepID=A0ABQ7W5U3_SOLTU|nr:hypothetical protein KY290_007478 [Solanum tuberosum]